MGIVLVLLAACALAWFATLQHSRYGLPLYTLAALPAALGLWMSLRAFRLPTLAVASVASTVVMVCFLCSLSIGMALHGDVPDHFPGELLLGESSRAEFRDSFGSYKALRYLDKATRGTDDQAASIGLPYNYFVEAPMWGTTLPAESNPFVRIITTSPDAKTMAKALNDAKIRWLVVDTNSPAGTQPWPPIWLTRTILTDDFQANHLELAYADSGASVYKIVTQSSQELTPNMLCDGDFEAPDPKCWVVAGDAKVEPSPQPTEAGPAAAKVTEAGTVTQSVAVCSGSFYRLSESIRTDVPRSLARIQVLWLSGDGKVLSASLKAVEVNDKWAPYTLPAQAPEGAKSAMVYVTAHSGQVWFDNVRFQRLASGSSGAGGGC
jgi:hypothetical protein